MELKLRLHPSAREAAQAASVCLLFLTPSGRQQRQAQVTLSFSVHPETQTSGSNPKAQVDGKGKNGAEELSHLKTIAGCGSDYRARKKMEKKNGETKKKKKKEIKL